MSLNDIISDIMPQQEEELNVTSYVGKWSGSYNFEVNRLRFLLLYYYYNDFDANGKPDKLIYFFSLHIDKLRTDKENGLFYISDDAYRLQNIIKILLLIPIQIQFNLVLSIRFW